MRLFHTSDWHLGRSLHRADLQAAQAAFVDHLVETVRAERVDAVLLSGDVHDRAVPPVDAVGLYSEALARVRDAGARVVLISGNHDSARRLGCGARLLDVAGVHVRTAASGVAEPVLLGDDHGPVAIYPIPYLEPVAVEAELPGPSGERSHAAVLGRALTAVRADLARRAPTRSVVLAHAWVTGGTGCESERDIAVGGVGAVAAASFDGFDYVALGHLHGPQTLAPHLRYSGSPLPYSFSEAGQVKGSWLVELGPTGLACVEQVPAPVHRRLSRLRGTLAELLTDPAHTGSEMDFVSVVLTDPTRPESGMDRLRARFPHALLLEWCPDGGAADGPGYRERVMGRSDVELALGFVEHVRGAVAQPEERALLEEAFEALRTELAADAPTSAAGVA